MTKYDLAGSQTEYQPGSNDKVLLNKQSISDKDEMDDVELFLLSKLYQHILEQDFPDHQIRVDDIKHWHKVWLGNVYDWTGTKRQYG